MSEPIEPAAAGGSEPTPATIGAPPVAEAAGESDRAVGPGGRPASQASLPARFTGMWDALRVSRARLVLVGAALALVAVLLFLAREALPPFVLGILLVFVLDPPVDWLDRRGVPRWVGILIVYAIAFALGIAIVVILVPPLLAQFQQFLADLPSMLADIRAWYEGLDLDPAVRQAIDSVLAAVYETLQAITLADVLIPVVGSLLGAVAIAIAYIITPFFAFFLIKDRPRLMLGLHRALPVSWRADVWAMGSIVNDVFGNWLRGTLILGSIMAVLAFVTMTAIGFVFGGPAGDFALLVAVVAFVSEFIPIIGPIISTVLAIVVSLGSGVPAAIVAGIVFFAYEQLEANVLVPRVQSKAIEVHASAVMAAVILGAAIAGFWGALLALPLVAMGKTLFAYAFRRIGGDIEPPGLEPLRPYELARLEEDERRAAQAAAGRAAQKAAHDAGAVQ